MRVLGVSDLHVDYESNARWVSSLSREDYQADIQIVAGDLSDSLTLVGSSLSALVKRFKQVHYVPGNHELRVYRDPGQPNSFDKFQQVRRIARFFGAPLETLRTDALSIIPLLGWYDHSFGEPGDDLRAVWLDSRACRWPAQMSSRQIESTFTALNEPIDAPRSSTVISFSHFLPRIDLMPEYVPQRYRYLYPVLGTDLLEQQVRRTGASIHIYGHSDVNRQITLEGVTCVNNAFGYPSKAPIAAERLLCVYESP